MAFAPFFSHPWQMCQPVVIRAPHIETVPCQETSRPIPFEQMQINADAQAQQEPQRQCPKLGPLSSSQRPERTFPRLPQPVTHPCIEPDVTLGPDRLFEGSGSSEPSASLSSSPSQCPRSPAVVRVRAPDSGADALVATEARIDAPHLSTKAMGGCVVLQAGLPTVAKHANASMHSNMEGTAIKSTSQSPRSLTEVEAESRRPEDEGIVLATTWRGNILNAGPKGRHIGRPVTPISRRMGSNVNCPDPKPMPGPPLSPRAPFCASQGFFETDGFMFSDLDIQLSGTRSGSDQGLEVSGAVSDTDLVPDVREELASEHSKWL